MIDLHLPSDLTLTKLEVVVVDPLVHLSEDSVSVLTVFIRGEGAVVTVDKSDEVLLVVLFREAVGEGQGKDSQ